MHITPVSHGDLLELRVEGRLDSEWADALRKAIDTALRQGYHAVVVDSTAIEYVSSAGLAVLVSAHQQFSAIRGFFGVGDARGTVEEVIRLTGLAKMLLCDLDTVRRARGQGRSTIQLPAQVAATALADFEVYDLQSDGGLRWITFGDPTKWSAGAYKESDALRTSFTEELFSIGLGAFGDRSTPQFGELLAAAGAVAVLPPGSGSVPDYQIASGDFVPEARMLYGVKWTGAYSKLLRFDVASDDRHITLANLIDQSMGLGATSSAAFVVLAETAGLVGAAVRLSPTLPPNRGSRFDHPEVREWLTFTPERAFAHSLALLVGIAARAEHSPAQLWPFLRPMSRSGTLHGHFHAAVFPFQPFKKRRVELAETVSNLFDRAPLLGLMHLLNDEREISGSGDSEFLRGACWVGALANEGEATA